MNKVLIKFATENDCFVQDYVQSIKHVLEQIQFSLESKLDLVLRDINGNTIGTITFLKQNKKETKQ